MGLSLLKLEAWKKGEMKNKHGEIDWKNESVFKRGRVSGDIYKLPGRSSKVNEQGSRTL